MTFREAPLHLACAVAALLAQACVQHSPGAEYPPPPSAPQNAAAAPVSSAPSADAGSALDMIVAPIALYPDPLIALVVTASTVPADITAASAYLVQYGDMSRIDGQPWDPSVRALAHYPAIITWMAQNIAWTQALGSAFISSPADVMDSVQRMRARALAAGTLASTPQQQVLSEDGEIEILPAQPDTVYVPVYDSDVMYSGVPYTSYGGPFINFGDPYPAGIWLSTWFDWHRHKVWSDEKHAWHDRGEWHPPHFDGDHPPPGAHTWHPAQNPRKGPQPGSSRPGSSPPLPRAMPGAPNPPPAHFVQPATQPNPATRSALEGPPLPRTTAPPLERPRLGVAGAAPPGAGGGAAGPAPRYSYTQPGPVAAPAANEGPARAAAPPPGETAPARGAEPARARPAEPARAAPVRAPAPAPAQDTHNNQPPK